jgi:hypothetical protein
VSGWGFFENPHNLFIKRVLKPTKQNKAICGTFPFARILINYFFDRSTKGLKTRYMTKLAKS